MLIDFHLVSSLVNGMGFQTRAGLVTGSHGYGYRYKFSDPQQTRTLGTGRRVTRRDLSQLVTAPSAVSSDIQLRPQATKQVGEGGRTRCTCEI